MDFNKAPKFSQAKDSKYTVVSKIIDKINKGGVDKGDDIRLFQTNWSQLYMKTRETNRCFNIEAILRCKFTNKYLRARMTLVKNLDGSVEFQEYDIHQLSSLLHDFAYVGPIEAERYDILLSDEDFDTIRYVNGLWQSFAMFYMGRI